MSQFIRLEISNYEALGKLIKSWALGVDRVGNGPYPQPASVDEYKAQLVRSGAATQDAVDAWYESYGGQLKNVKFVQSTPDTLYLRLPMVAMVKAREEGFVAGEDYLLPDFYSTDFFGNAPQVPPTTEAAKMTAHNQRVGDYSIAQCG